MQIIKRGDHYQVRIPLGRDSTGKRKFFTKTLKEATRKEAEKYAVAVQRSIDTGEFVHPTSTTLNEHLDHWLGTIVKRKVQLRTFEWYTDLMNWYVRPVLGTKRLTEIREVAVQTLLSEMSERGLSPLTVRHAHRVLKTALQRAVKWRLISRNPCDGLDLPSVSQKREVKSLTREQAADFLGAARSDRFNALFVLALGTGMRPEEYLGLQWKDVDFERGTIRVERTLVISKHGGGWFFGVPKSARSRRTLKPAPSVIRTLAEHKKNQLEERMKAGALWRNLDLVFTTHDGAPLIHTNLVKAHFHPVRIKARIPPRFTLYSLRHTWVTLAVSNGVNLKTVSEQAGHASVAFTLDHYGHVLPKMLDEASNQMEAVLFSPPTDCTQKTGSGVVE